MLARPRLGLQQILVGRPEIRDRFQVIDAGSVEKAGKVHRVLGGVHGDLDDPVRDDRDHPLGIATGSPQGPSAWTPGASRVSKIEALPLELLGERVHRSRRVPASARLPATARD
jgi:hypothetical protein